VKTGVERAAVVPVIVAEEGERPALSALYAAVSEAVKYRPTVALVLEEEPIARALECGADEACVAAELSNAGVELGVLVVVNTALTPALFGLKLIDAKNKATIDEAVLQLDAKEIVRELEPRVAAMLEKRGHTLNAKLTVKLDPPASALSIDGKPSLAGAHFLAPGKHQLVASHEEHRAEAREVELKAGQDTALEIALVEEAKLVESPWLWIGVAAVLAGAATALLIGTRSTERYVCAPFEGADCDP
jgi:hypothetical protein